MPNIDLSILNQRQTPAFYADVLANRPAAGFIGRIFVSTNTYEFYRDNGTGWDLIGGPGTGTITGGGSLYRVGIWTSTSNLGESNNLVFDYSTNRLGINTNTPGASLDVHSAANSIAQFNQTTATNNSLLVLQNSGSTLWRLGNYYNAGANDFGVFDVVGAIQPVTIKKTTGQVLIGTSNVGSGKLVVASATGDNGVQIVGASAPSLRIDNAETGPTKRAGLGISTATNNFIQGSADRDFCIFNGSTTAASPMLFGIYDAGLTNVQEAARISAARNFLVGTSVDAGFKADINGTARIQNEITVNGTGTNTIDRITITRSGSDSQINGLGGGFMRLNAPRINIVQGLIVSNSFGTGTGTMVIRSGVDNPTITEMQFASTNASTILARFFANTGNFGINQTTDAGFKLDVNGLGHYNDNLRIDQTTTSGYALNIVTPSGGNRIFSALRTGAFTCSLEINSSNSATFNGALYFTSGITIGVNTGSFSPSSGFLYVGNGISVGQGSTLNASAMLDVGGTGKGFLPPRLTTAQKNGIATPAAGLMVYDTTLNKLAVFTGVNWETVTSV